MHGFHEKVIEVALDTLKFILSEDYYLAAMVPYAPNFEKFFRESLSAMAIVPRSTFQLKLFQGIIAYSKNPSNQ